MASLVRPAFLLRQTALAGINRHTARSSIWRDSMRVAAFQTSSRRSILPAGPQVVKGTVNDPAPVPDPHPTHGSYHWTFERILAIGLVPLSVAPFAAGSLNPLLDALLVTSLVLHSHLGFQNIITDYIPKRRFPGIARLLSWLLNAATVAVGIGMYEFETNDVGLTAALGRIWKA